MATEQERAAVAPLSQPAKGKKYRVNARQIYRNPEMVTLVPADLSQRMGPNTAVVSVALGASPVTRKLPATKDRPAIEMTSEVATQAQLEYLFKVEKNHLIEEYD